MQMVLFEDPEESAMSLTAPDTADVIGFDYTAMPPEVAVKAREAIATFDKGQNDIAQTMVLVGLALLDVKEALDHGLFGRWLKAEFGLTERTAQNYMNVARSLGSKTEIVSDLPLAITYQLAAPSMPDDARHQIVERIEKEKISATEVKEMIQLAREREKQRQATDREETRRSKLTPEQIKAEAKREKSQTRSKALREQKLAHAADEQEVQHRDAIAAEVRAAGIIARSVSAELRGELLTALQAAGRPFNVAMRRALGEPPHANDFFEKKYRVAFAEDIAEHGPIPTLTDSMLDGA